MFGSPKKKPGHSGDKHPGRSMVMSALLLKGDSFPLKAFGSQVAKMRLGGQPVSQIEQEDDKSFSCQIGGDLLVAGLMPAPYPAGDLEGPIATSILWPRQPPIESVKQHRSHLLLIMTGEKSNPIRRRLILTAITAQACQSSEVMAVYWPEAAQVIFPSLFRDLAKANRSQKEPPIMLWVDLRMFPNPDGSIGVFTSGLKPLGHLEIEIPRIEMASAELRDWLTNILYYLMENGPVLEHGQTIGMSAEHQVRILHRPSRFGHEGTVISLEP